MIDARVARLARTFRVVAAAALAPAAWAACSSDGTEVLQPDAGAPFDATAAGPDANATEAATADAVPDRGGADTGVATDAADAAPSCYGSVSVNDAGPDGEELCDFQVPCGLAAVQLGAVGCVVVPLGIDGGPVDEAGAVGFPYCYLLDGQGCVDGGYVLLDGGVAFECIGCPGGGGRRPAGERVARGRGRTRAGAYFAGLAELEAASVRAFAGLARELARHGAPAELVAAARASAGDERRHARVMRELARRYGGLPRRRGGRGTAGRGAAGRGAAHANGEGRALVDLAVHNAMEGCVRETYGALLNAVQAERAKEPAVRAAILGIAGDELRHAALSWEIAAWAEGKLTAGERARVARERRHAAARLVASAARDVPPADVRALAGLPDGAEASGLAAGLARQLLVDG